LHQVLEEYEANAYRQYGGRKLELSLFNQFRKAKITERQAASTGDKEKIAFSFGGASTT